MNTYRHHQWIKGWLQILDGTICILTLTLYRPMMATTFTIWALGYRAQREG